MILFFAILEDMSKPELTKSFQLTEITAPVLEQLRIAGWSIKELANAGILMFSQASTTQQHLFAAMASKDVDFKQDETARQIFRKWIVELLVDALASEEFQNQLPEPVRAALEDEAAAGRDAAEQKRSREQRPAGRATKRSRAKGA